MIEETPDRIDQNAEEKELARKKAQLEAIANMAGEEVAEEETKEN